MKLKILATIIMIGLITGISYAQSGTQLSSPIQISPVSKSSTTPSISQVNVQQGQVDALIINANSTNTVNVNISLVGSYGDTRLLYTNSSFSGTATLYPYVNYTTTTGTATNIARRIPTSQDQMVVTAYTSSSNVTLKACLIVSNP